MTCLGGRNEVDHKTLHRLSAKEKQDKMAGSRALLFMSNSRHTLVMQPNN